MQTYRINVECRQLNISLAGVKIVYSLLEGEDVFSDAII